MCFLGGKDLEMDMIAKILKEKGISFEYNRDGWNIKADSYADKIEEAKKELYNIVLVEVPNNINLEEGSYIDIDHHNEKSGSPASILQVYELLGEEVTREIELVAINDVSYVKGLLEAGATKEEILEIRRKDRECQEITAEQDLQGKEAYDKRENIGTLEVYYMEHSKCAALTDYRMEQTDIAGEMPRENCLILSENGEINYFGDAEICAELKAAYEKSWIGGDGVDGNGVGTEGKNAFWGVQGVSQEEILLLLSERAKDVPVYSLIEARDAKLKEEAVELEK